MKFTLRSIARSSRALTLAAAVFAPGALLAQEPAADSGQLEEVTVTARFREEPLQTTPARHHSHHRRVAGAAQRHERGGHRQVLAQRHHQSAGRRLRPDARREHPRRRPHGLQAGVRARRADLRGRCGARALHRRDARPARPRARGSAARPARHAVRQERGRRRHPHGLAQADGRWPGLHRRHVRQVQSHRLPRRLRDAAS